MVRANPASIIHPPCDDGAGGTKNGKLALVFGREDEGLTEEARSRRPLPPWAPQRAAATRRCLVDSLTTSLTHWRRAAVALPPAALAPPCLSDWITSELGRPRPPSRARQEVRRCGAVCTLPVGRLQESLSLSHAVVIALSALFQARDPPPSPPGPAGGLSCCALRQHAPRRPRRLKISCPRIIPPQTDAVPLARRERAGGGAASNH